MKLIDLARDEWDLESVTRTAVRYRGRVSRVLCCVPLEEIGDARLLPVERGASLLKWLRVTYEGLVALGSGE